VFPISEKMVDTLTTQAVRRDRMVALPEGVDVASFAAPNKKDIAIIRNRYSLENKRVVCYVGTMARQRQLDVLVRSFARVVSACPDAHLLMVRGDAYSRDLEDLRSLARQLQLSERITFTGFLPRSAIPAHVCAATVGVSPIPNNRVFANNSPIKILEYMAAGVPVVATDIPSQRDIVEQSGCGVCVGFDQKELADAITRILSAAPGALQEYGKLGRRFCESHRDFRMLSQVAARSYGKLFFPRDGTR